ncbi:YfeK family protein [Comamonas humi]
MKTALLAAALLLQAAAWAQPPSPATAREIDQLFAALRQSGCEFSRNGAWYGAAKAAEHLQRKYDYLRERGLVPSTESFIERAATKSSVSGQPYQVRCGQAAPVASSDWFTGQLRELRK